MTLYTENNDVVNIDECDLQFLGKQLLQLVHTYREEVVIRDESTTRSLDKLEHIGKMIVKTQYDQLINDVSLINIMYKDLTEGNFYLDMTR